MQQAFVCDAIRTLIGRYGGAFSSVRPDDLAALTLKLAERVGTDAEVVRICDVRKLAAALLPEHYLGSADKFTGAVLEREHRWRSDAHL